MTGRETDAGREYYEGFLNGAGYAAVEAQKSPDSITVFEDIALIAVVGMGLSRTVGVASVITTALADAGINIRLLNQGASEINVILGVESKDFNRAICAIYDAFDK